MARLNPAPAELVVVDSASRDTSVAIARAHSPAATPTQIVPLSENRGFAAATNVAIAASASPWILTLNPDAEPEPDFLARLLGPTVDSGRERVGAITGRLLRPGEPRRLDACGMYLERAWRHLDRGSGELDCGQYAEAERVFGATGAASLWRRRALLDVAIAGEVFDEQFHSYREDAELSFRLRERGWEIVYEPTARALHRRRVLPERRRDLPEAINYHSLKNRYLLRAGHQSGGNLLRTLPWTLPRDLAAFAWVLLCERSSLPAYRWLWRHRRDVWARRRLLRAQRSVPDRTVERWFAQQGEPLP